jgi:hypothetical protein
MGQEDVMKTISILPLVSLLALGCATARTSDHLAPTRGAMTVTGGARKAVIAGPASIHVYSGFAGGQLYAVPVVTGTDVDCRNPDGVADRVVTINADRVVTIEVGAAHLACLGATSTDRRLEVLWHVNNNAPPPPRLVVAERY